MLSKHFKAIYGKRIYLTLFNEQDITSEYISWLNNTEVTKYSRQRLIKHNLASSKEYLKSFKNSSNLFLAIKSVNNNQIVGTMTAYFNKKNNHTDLGIMIGDDYWGKGYGKEAWSVLMKWLLGQEFVSKVTGATLEKNVSMLALMKNVGMNLDKVKRSNAYDDNQPCNIVFFSKQ